MPRLVLEDERSMANVYIGPRLVVADKNGPRDSVELVPASTADMAIKRDFDLWLSARQYANRMLGATDGPSKGPSIPSICIIFWAWLGSFISILALALINNYSAFGTSHVMLIGSFGAQAVLLFAAPQAPFSQPWNAIAGNTFSALIGVFVRKYMAGSTPGPGVHAVQAALAVSLSIVTMLLTG